MDLRACIVLLAAGLASPLASLAQAPLPVVVERPTAAAFGERFELTGDVAAERRARLSPRVDGLVAQVRVDAGDRVEAGALLLSLDDALARQALGRLTAQAAEAQARVTEAERLLAEARQLVERQFVPASQVATREAELELARAALASARAAEREQAELVERHGLPAPFAGLVASRQAEVGEWVQRGATVVELIDLDALRIEVQVPAERHGDLAAGAEYTLLAGGIADAIPARVEAVLPVVDPGARTFLLRLRPQAPHPALLPGVPVRVAIALPVREPALAVPRDALLRRPDGSRVLFVVEADGADFVARERAVRVLRDAGAQVAVAGELDDTARIVVRGNEALRDGAAVTPAER